MKAPLLQAPKNEKRGENKTMNSKTLKKVFLTCRCLQEKLQKISKNERTNSRTSKRYFYVQSLPFEIKVNKKSCKKW